MEIKFGKYPPAAMFAVEKARKLLQGEFARAAR